MEIIRQTFRSLLRQKAFSASIVLVTAFGIGANAAIFAITYSVLLRQLPFKASDELVVIAERARSFDSGLASPTAYLEWRDRNPPFSDMAAFMWWEGSGENPTITVSVTPNYFAVLGVKPILGRTFTEEENRAGFSSAMILSYEVWQEKFGGNPGIVGKPVRDGDWNPIVVGVMPPGPLNLNIGWGHIWRPIRLRQQYNRAETTSARYLKIVGRLSPGMKRSQGQAALTAIQHELQRERPEIFKGYEVELTPLRDALTDEFRPALLVLTGAAGCLLLLACASLANMLVARSAAHEREMAVRVALGAARRHLALRVLTANLILAAIGAALGVILCSATITVIAHLEPVIGAARSLAGYAWSIVGFCAALAFSTALIISIPVIATLNQVNVHHALKDGGRGGTSGFRRQNIRGWLVSAEIALALSLLVVSGLLARNFVGLMHTDLGFKPNNVLLLESNIGDSVYNTNKKRIAYYRPLFRSLAGLPGVIAAGGLRYFPMHARLWTTAIQIKENPVPAAQQPTVFWNRVAGDYFTAMRIPLVAGRLPSAREMWEHSEAVLINSVAARAFFPQGSAVGKHIQLGDQAHEVMGVVDSVRQAGLGRAPGPEIFSLMAADESTGILTIAIRTREKPGAEMIKSIVAAVRRHDETQSQPALIALTTFLGDTVSARRTAARMGTAFAFLSLVLSALGIYGLISYFVTQRTAEFGIRRALGATRGQVVRLVLAQSLHLAARGLVMGLTVSVLVARLLSALLVGIPSFDAPTFVLGPCLLLIAAILAAPAPAFRATRINTIDALRRE